MRQQRFKIRANIVGSGMWSCPDCGYIQKLRLTPGSRWRVKCTHESCGHVFRVGLIFHRQKQGEGKTGHPPDTVIGESMPESRLAPEAYSQGKPVHRVEEGGEPKGSPFEGGLMGTSWPTS